MNTSNQCVYCPTRNDLGCDLICFGSFTVVEKIDSFAPKTFGFLLRLRRICSINRLGIIELASAIFDNTRSY